MYEAEGIPLHHLQFKSNVHCISLIEGRDAGSGYQGILHVLDEFSKTERDIDTDATYAALLLRKFGSKATGVQPKGKAAKMYKSAGMYIEFPKFPPVEWFRIKHFAGPVKYEFANFLEKNRDKTFIHLKQMMAGKTPVHFEVVQDAWRWWSQKKETRSCNDRWKICQAASGSDEDSTCHTQPLRSLRQTE
jgi:myosin heavy subunit